MKRRSARMWAWGVGLGLGFGLGLAATPARAQVGYSGAGAGNAGALSPFPGASGLNANPYMNPYTNPFLNPLMSQQTMSPGNAALYFFAAQQATGGIGSGRISGSRPAPGTVPGQPGGVPGQPGGRPPATRGASNRPGASASRYFDRDYPTTNSGPPRYYDRQSRHFPGIGR